MLSTIVIVFITAAAAFGIAAFALVWVNIVAKMANVNIHKICQAINSISRRYDGMDKRVVAVEDYLEDSGEDSGEEEHPRVKGFRK